MARASLRVGAASLARYQLALALALGCDRVICLAEKVQPELTQLQAVAEESGCQLMHAAGLPGLMALVSAGDEVFAFADGLLAWPDVAIEALEGPQAVLVQPIEAGLARGFERMDINHAAAGAMRVPGHLVARLADHPADCDVFSTLQRIALQAGIGQRLLPAAAHEAGCWNLVRSDAEAHVVEPLWIRLLTAAPGHNTPSMMLARRGVRLFGPALLHAGSSGTVVAIAGVVTCALALVLGWFGVGLVGFVVAAWGWLLFMAAALLGRVERRSLRLAAPRTAPLVLYGAAMDAVLALMLAWTMAAEGGLALLWLRGFIALVLLGLLRLVRLACPGSVWLEDRGLLALALAGLAGLGWLAPGTGVLALLCLAYGILRISPSGD